MATTFGDVWRQVRLRVPDAPPLLVRDWVMNAYRQFWDRRLWSQSIYQGQLTWADAVSNLACTVTYGSATVTSVGLFTSDMAGRQFRVGTYPIYTILTVPDANTLTLNEPYYGSPTGAITTGQVLDAYGTLPTDFGAFQVVVDPTNQRLIPWWATQQELVLIDPTRSSASSTPRLLVAAQESIYPTTLGQVQYEFWPKPTAAGVFPYYASRRPVPLSDTDTFRGILGTRSDVLITGALAECATWPGTRDRPNPYFSLTNAKWLSDSFTSLCNQLDLRDDDVYTQTFDTIPFQRWSGWAWAYNTHLLQQTDATIGDYAGYLGGGYAGY